jgi:ABC-type transport system involved in cytochrome bd biosynthesis fused ATPase/permease subunit
MLERFVKWFPFMVSIVLLVMVVATVLFLQAGLGVALAFNSIGALLIIGLMFARSRSNLAYRRIRIDQNRLRRRSERSLR